jgi:two-component system OmpR family sensor kinase
MKRSLQQRLSLLLGGAVLFAGLVAAAASFILAYGEATEFQDDILRQIAVLAAHSSRTPPAGADVAMQPPARLKLKDTETRISVIRLPGDPRPDWLTANLAVGFHTLEAGGEPARVFVLTDPPGGTTVVAQPTETRDEIALNSALHTLLPLVLLLPVMAWLIVRIVRRELAPVSRLAAHLDAQPAERPHPLSVRGVPEEIVPFVQAINRLLERVSDLVEQQRRFITDAAHEIRSPLTALSVQAQNLQQAASPEAMHERFAPLQAGIERARKLTEQLLRLARIQAGTEPTVDVDVSALARELIGEYLPLAEAKGIDVGLDERVALTIDAAPDNLRLVITNGLENALKYVPAGGEVTIRLDATDLYAIIDIVDNGPGIPEAERARVLDPFYRTPGTRGEGSGLGLTIAREAAGRLGGNLDLLDRPEGSGLVVRYRQRRAATASSA